MSKRTEWQFQFSASRVGLAAEKKAEHHRSRQAWWQDQLETAEADLKANGVEMRSMPVTGGVNFQPMFDPQRQARYNECRGKVDGHQKKAEEYETWARMMKTQADAANKMVPLDYQDVEYFGL